MEERQYLDLVGLAEYDTLIKAFINGKIFVGTYEEYNAANAAGNIQIGCVVILTDQSTGGSGSGGNGSGSGDSSDTTSPTNAVLGYAVLGQMVLG